MKLTLSCDDGCVSDLRGADLCRKYEIPCVFYWPVEWRSLAYDKGYEPLTVFDALSIAQDFEIGSHTVTHRHLTSIDQREAEIEIADSKFMHEALWNKPVTKFCPPRGYTNEYLTEYTLELYESQRLTKGPGLVHVHPNSGANGNLGWLDYFRLVRESNENDGNIELWMHSWELDRYNLWDELEEVLREYSAT